jgi:hypothetical protein
VETVRPEREGQGISPLLRRRTDRIQDVASWLLTALGLLVIVLALVTGVRSYEENVERNTAEAADRTQVDAVLLAPASLDTGMGRTSQPGRPMPVPVPARYTTTDGVEHIAKVWVPAPRAAGTTVPIWVNRAGDVTTEPNPRAEAVRDATIAALEIGVAGLLVVASLWVMMHIGVHRANLRRWDHEWEQAEPQWSERPPA